MLSPFDDHPIHQLAEPLTQLATSDRNAFERYRFHGGRADGSVLFACTLALYPNREIVDAALTIALDGVQHSAHASARLHPGDRHTHVGPFSLEVSAPLQTFRILVEGPQAEELGLQAALRFHATSAPIEAPRHTVPATCGETRDTVRFTQWGEWDGDLTIDGRQLTLTRDSTVGVRERSWGVTPVGEPVGGAPQHRLPQRFAMWSCARLDDEVIDVALEEDEQGRRTHTAATRTTDDAGGEPLRDVGVAVDWQPGTRRPASATLAVTPWGTACSEVELTPRGAIAMRGLGYESPDWVHGAFKAEAAVGRTRWRVADLDPTDVHNLHWHQLCHARRGDQEGVAWLDVLAFGPHEPTGLTGFVDGAGPTA